MPRSRSRAGQNHFWCFHSTQVSNRGLLGLLLWTVLGFKHFLVYFAGQNKEALENAGKVATEAIENMRTVASMTIEDKMLQYVRHAADNSL